MTTPTITLLAPLLDRLFDQDEAARSATRAAFAHLTDAENLAAALNPLTSWPEVVLLRLSNYDNLDASVTYKDDRFPRH